MDEFQMNLGDDLNMMLNKLNVAQKNIEVLNIFSSYSDFWSWVVHTDLLLKANISVVVAMLAQTVGG